MYFAYLTDSVLKTLPWGEIISTHSSGHAADGATPDGTTVGTFGLSINTGVK